MAIDFIKIDTTTTTATQAAALKGFIATLRSAYSQGKGILGIMTHNNDGTNFAPLEAIFGLPTGQGHFVFDLVNGTINAMEGTMQNSNAVDLTVRVG